jgi:hypothetical protein
MEPERSQSSNVTTELKYWRDPDLLLRAVEQHHLSLISAGSGESTQLFSPSRWAETEGSYYLIPEHPTPQAVAELCEKVLKGGAVCQHCNELYHTECPLLRDAQKLINARVSSTLPGCMAVALSRRNWNLVLNYAVKRNMITLPLWQERPVARCEKLREWTLCREDIFCDGYSPLNYDNQRIPAALAGSEASKNRGGRRKRPEPIQRIMLRLGTKNGTRGARNTKRESRPESDPHAL